MNKLIKSYCLLLLFAGNAFGVQWEAVELSRSMQKLNEVGEYEFVFTNTGGAAVQINSVEASCGCVSLNWEKREYAVGERGVIRARFDTKNFWGSITALITVKTSDGGTHVLRMRADIPEILSIQPRVLFWERGSEKSEKTIIIQTFFPDLMEITGAVANNDWFQTEFRKLEKGRYEVKVRPVTTVGARMGTIALQITAASSVPSGFPTTIHARVK